MTIFTTDHRRERTWSRFGKNPGSVERRREDATHSREHADDHVDARIELIHDILNLVAAGAARLERRLPASGKEHYGG